MTPLGYVLFCVFGLVGHAALIAWLGTEHLDSPPAPEVTEEALSE